MLAMPRIFVSGHDTKHRHDDVRCEMRCFDSPRILSAKLDRPRDAAASFRHFSSRKHFFRRSFVRSTVPSTVVVVVTLEPSLSVCSVARLFVPSSLPPSGPLGAGYTVEIGPLSAALSASIYRIL